MILETVKPTDLASTQYEVRQAAKKILFRNTCIVLREMPTSRAKVRQAVRKLRDQLFPRT